MGQEDYEIVRKILEANKNKDFIQRILRPDDYPALPALDGKTKTHLMSWGESDGKYQVYPTIIHKDGELIQYKDDEAAQHAMKTGEYVEFDNPADAAWFSERYKAYWEGPPKKDD